MIGLLVAAVVYLAAGTVAWVVLNVTYWRRRLGGKLGWSLRFLAGPRGSIRAPWKTILGWPWFIMYDPEPKR